MEQPKSITRIFVRLCLVGNIVLTLLWLHSTSKHYKKSTEIDRLEPLLFDVLNSREVNEDRGTKGSPEVTNDGFDLESPSFNVEPEDVDEEWIISYRTRFPKGTDPKDREAKPMTITGWTYFQPTCPSWFRDGVFHRHHCPNLHEWMKCEYHPSASIQRIYQSDAVLFHAKGITANNSIPPSRPQHQKWILYETEPPTNLWNSAKKDADYWKLFNISATFTFDADIPVHHHRFMCQEKENWVSPGINYAAGKTKKVAWFVSHCKSSSRRELYVEQLKKYIDVDVYGFCGLPICRKDAKDVSPENCMMELLEKSYKFYLSFENAFCEEYATEKLGRFLKINILQIVLGAYDYSNVLPEGSYLDVRDYKSPKHLADYLYKLDEDDDLYNSYIDKKNSVVCERSKSMNFHCMLCEYLHNHRYEKQQVFDIASFWSVDKRCQSPLQFYENIADEIIPSINFTLQSDVFL